MRCGPLVLAGLIVLLSACSSERDTDADHGQEAAATDADAAKQLLADLRASDYQNFERAPGWATRMSGSTTHHGKYLDVYLGPALAAAIDGGAQAPWPVGSIIVKDGWSDADGTQLSMISILRKDADQKWFGAEFSPSGAVQEAGTNFAECRECHSAAKDFTLSF